MQHETRQNGRKEKIKSKNMRLYTTQRKTIPAGLPLCQYWWWSSQYSKCKLFVSALLDSNHPASALESKSPFYLPILFYQYYNSFSGPTLGEPTLSKFWHNA